MILLKQKHDIIEQKHDIIKAKTTKREKSQVI